MLLATASDGYYWTLAALLGAAGLFVLYRALLHDRSRGKKRCPKCWYDMSGAPGLTCSECGRTVKRERNQYNTRRHKRIAVLGVMVCGFAIASGITPKIRADGWISVTPTTALILYLPWTTSFSANDPVLLELDKRIDAMRLATPGKEETWWDWQWDLLVDRCMIDMQTRPLGTLAWEDSCGKLLWRSAELGYLIEDAERRDKIKNLCPASVIWLSACALQTDGNVYCEFNINLMRRGWNRLSVQVTSNLDGSPHGVWDAPLPAMCGTGMIGYSKPDFAFTGRLRDGETTLILTLHVYTEVDKWCVSTRQLLGEYEIRKPVLGLNPPELRAEAEREAFTAPE